MHLHPVHQRLVSRPIGDVEAAVRNELDRLDISVPQGRMAVTVGSRGIANLACIVRTAGDWLRDRGAEPFAVPAMGSHNGATAAGQREMLESLGLSAAALGMPIESTMETVVIGQADGVPIHVDRLAYEAGHVLLINRIKLHTSFDGPLASGLAKMAAVGLGKLGGAEAFHTASTDEKPGRLELMAEAVLGTPLVWAGLAILEDGYDQTNELQAIPANDILAREPALLTRHREMFPQLPIDRLNVLVVETIGKNFSGTGLDTNVIGRRGLNDAGDLPKPIIDTIAALSLSNQSQGNAVGVGLADCITQRLRSEIDLAKTTLNAKTAGQMKRAEIPSVFASDEALFETLATRQGEDGWMVVPNTLELEWLLVSPDIANVLQDHPRCEVGNALPVMFTNGTLQIDWNGLADG